MKVFEAIKSRYSCRGYEKAEVDFETVKKIVEAGTYAPSAKNLKPYKIIYIPDTSILAPLEKLHPTIKVALEASFCLLIIGDVDKQPNRTFLDQDASAVATTMLLMATSLGLNSLWNGIVPGSEYEKEMMKLIGLDEKHPPIINLIFGKGNMPPRLVKSYDESKLIDIKDLKDALKEI